MSQPPRRPAGPPPPRQPPPADVGGGLGIKRPAGPPPGMNQLAAIKPPPFVPPPSGLQTNQQRPPIQGAHHPSDSPPVGGKRPLDGSPSSPPTAEAGAKRPTAPPPPAQHKAGGITMFEEQEKPTVAAESASAVSGPRPGMPPPRFPPPRGPPGSSSGGKPGSAAAADGSPIRGPRPAPPRAVPPGIPTGQPLPPSDAPLDGNEKAPPPLRPPPLAGDGSRAPPREDPEEELKKKRQTLLANVKPPETQPPLLRVKKEVAPVVLKRREKDMPELEESSSDEEKEGAMNLVKQPLPFGVLKQEVPALKLYKSAAQEEQEEEEAAAAQVALAGSSSAMAAADSKTPKVNNKKITSISSQKVAPGTHAVLDEEGQAFIKAPTVLHGSLSSKGSAAVPAAAPPDGQKIKSDFVPDTAEATASSGDVQLDKHFDDSAIGKQLSRGRLSIRVIEGLEIRRKDDKDRIPRNDPFVKLRLGAAERHPWKATKVKRKQDAHPLFDNQIIYFDMIDPVQYILSEDIQLCIELWNKSTTRNDLVGSVTMSVLRFMKQPFVSYTEKVPIYYPGATRTTMKLVVEIVFEEARSGMVQLLFYEAQGLRNIDPMGQQDPFVQVSLGKNYKKRIPSVKNGGIHPYFNESEILLWLDQDNWVEDLTVSVLDEDAKDEKPIGETHFSLLPYMKLTPDMAKDDTFDLFYYLLIDPKDDTEKKEVACGQLMMKVRFFPAGKLTVTIDRAKNLLLPETSNGSSAVSTERFDPYVKLTMDSKAVQIMKRTPADKDGGKDPVWKNKISFDIVDQYLLDVKVFNQNMVAGDVLIGFAEVSLLPAYRNGLAEFWTTLKQKKTNGGIREVGDLLIKLLFDGPIGIAYPQYCPEVDSFDDRLRKSTALTNQEQAMKEQEEAAAQQAKQPIDTVPVDNADRSAEDLADEQAALTDYNAKRISEEVIAQEFTEEEIIAAFKFIDLDHNNFVGAAEIRHILICMGEMITDEEIDMMISLIDSDGDGQVSFKEFRTLVLHPNPGAADMHKEISREKDNELMKDKQAMTGKVTTLDLSAFQRQKEMLAREQKKKMIISFIDDNDLTFDTLKQSYLFYLELPKEQRLGGRVKFPQFCSVLRVEPIQEYKNLHALYDDEEMGDMDLREFLLSVMNFLPGMATNPAQKDERVRFSFEMFDEGKTGFIAQREVEEILRGNHMLSLASVRRKAETIIKQANVNEAGALTVKEFLVVSRKFPNILFPTAGILNTSTSGNTRVKGGAGISNASVAAQAAALTGGGSGVLLPAAMTNKVSSAMMPPQPGGGRRPVLG